PDSQLFPGCAVITSDINAAIQITHRTGALPPQQILIPRAVGSSAGLFSSRGLSTEKPKVASDNSAVQGRSDAASALSMACPNFENALPTGVVPGPCRKN